ncbi:MAG: DUF4270 domain-containing protein [Bacteroidales bacterium]|nr:DUF4270 domain-containing protein [Bacteroidales bacterium]
MKIRRYITGVRAMALGVVTAMALSPLAGCDDDSTLGGSLVENELEIVVNDTSFTLTGHSVAADPILSRTTTQLLGNIKASEYGTLSSDFVTQFMPAISIDTAGIAASDIDSLKLFMQMATGAFTGDSIVPMGLSVYRLNKELKTPIYNTFDPAGKYDPTPIGSTFYNFTTYGEPDSIKKLNYRTISVKLPVELGRELYSAYRRKPSDFASPTAFADNVFKGIYVRTTFGSGRIIRVSQTSMRLYYHVTSNNATTGRDTTIKYVGNYFAVTPEIISNNNISLRMARSLTDKVAAGRTLIVAPAGYSAEVRFPVPEIIRNYNEHVTDLGIVNSLTLKIPVAVIDNDCGIEPPANILMVLKNKKDEFFADNKISDDKISFLGTYDSSAKTYTFSGMRQYLLDMMQKDALTTDDYTFMLVPVNVGVEQSTSGSSTINSITPYITAPAMVELLIDKAKITLVYSKQTLKM